MAAQYGIEPVMTHLQSLLRGAVAAPLAALFRSALPTQAPADSQTVGVDNYRFESILDQGRGDYWLMHQMRCSGLRHNLIRIDKPLASLAETRRLHLQVALTAKVISDRTSPASTPVACTLLQASSGKRSWAGGVGCNPSRHTNTASDCTHMRQHVAAQLSRHRKG
jgi:hypothetical protein